MFNTSKGDRVQDFLEDIAVEKFTEIIEEYNKEHGVYLKQEETLWLGTYNSGIGTRFTFSDGSTFSLRIDHISVPRVGKKEVVYPMETNNTNERVMSERRDTLVDEVQELVEGAFNTGRGFSLMDPPFELEESMARERAHELIALVTAARDTEIREALDKIQAAMMPDLQHIVEVVRVELGLAVGGAE